jgi:hypothetical protein
MAKYGKMKIVAPQSKFDPEYDDETAEYVRFELPNVFM